MNETSLRSRTGRSNGARIARAFLARTVLAGVLLLPLLTARSARSDEPLRVYTTVSDLAELAEIVGGDAVEASAMIDGREDAHFAEPKPSYVRELARTDVFIVVGMELEVGYLPTLLSGARNPRIQPGAPGYIDASTAVTPLGKPTASVDRSMGDVHAQGNPHYLNDPIAGLAVSRLIADRLSTLRPASAQAIEERYLGFKDLLTHMLVGKELTAKYDGLKLATLFERGALEEFLSRQGDRDALDGWLGAMLPYFGTRAIDDHDIWPYFARRFGLRVIGHLEPKNGIPPTTKHLRSLVERMSTDNVPLLIQSAYYDPRHARFVSEATGARVAVLSHQSGAVIRGEGYLETVDRNVRTLLAALDGKE